MYEIRLLRTLGITWLFYLEGIDGSHNCNDCIAIYYPVEYWSR